MKDNKYDSKFTCVHILSHHKTKPTKIQYTNCKTKDIDLIVFTIELLE